MQHPEVYETTSREDFYAMVRKEAEKGDVVVLDSQLPSHPSSGRSFLFAGFDAVFRWKQFHHEAQDAHGDPWKALSRFREQFPGYCCGYLGYDLKNAREALHTTNADDVELPDMWMGRPTRLYILENNGDVPKISHGDFSIDDLHTRISAATYKSRIEKAQSYIQEGDIYEVNLSHQLEAGFRGDPFDLFIDMRNRGPVPFGAFLKMEDVSACCASPERFLTRNGDSLISDPIKGTRPRGRDAGEDEAIIRELQSSEKDKAENLMIVDLVRNDFSRVCESGSVKVRNLFEIQHFNTVHQMVSRVEGKLNNTVSTEEALAACFPMGSMTGAPKIRAMQIIEELEDYKRGLYSGAIGVITPEGDFNFNVVIRTAIIRNGQLYYAAGGAITADSDPASEWDETLVKSRALGIPVVREP